MEMFRINIIFSVIFLEETRSQDVTRVPFENKKMMLSLRMVSRVLYNYFHFIPVFL